MSCIQEVGLRPLALERFEGVVEERALREAERALAGLAERLAGRRFWHVNSTAAGGGVAEMLRFLLGYLRGAGVDARWLVIHGRPEFFRVTKRLHHALHGERGDGSSLDGEGRRVYEETLAENAPEICERVRPRDIVMLHDPQTAGLAPALQRRGARVIWRSHVGTDEPNDQVAQAWELLAPYLAEVPLLVFSRAAYAPSFCDPERARVVQPSIDPFAVKNEPLEAETVTAVLTRAGLLAEPAGGTRGNGRAARVRRRAEVVREDGALSPRTRLLVQISRWDPLKDPVGVMRGFASFLAGSDRGDVALVLAGPDTRGVSDDPEGASTFAQVVEARAAFPRAVRERIQLASLPMVDLEENALVVNALQRHATVIAQKSLREGFGLTVTEAMWKARPLVAGAVGGIQDQIEDRVHGRLLPDPSDLEAFALALAETLLDHERAARWGKNAQERARERFLALRHLRDYAELVEQVDS